MHRRSLAAVLFLTAAVAAMTVSLSPGREEQAEPVAPASAPAPPQRVLPGFHFRGGYLSNRRTIEVADAKSRSIIGGLAVTADGKTLAAADTFGNAVVLVPLDAPDQKRAVALGPPGKELPAGIYGPMFRTV